MKITVLLIFLFNFLISYSAKAEANVAHACTEAVIQLEENFDTSGMGTLCPLETDEEDVVVESSEHFPILFLSLKFQEPSVPENYFVSQQPRPPNFI